VTGKIIRLILKAAGTYVALPGLSRSLFLSSNPWLSGTVSSFCLLLTPVQISGNDETARDGDNFYSPGVMGATWLKTPRPK